IVESPIPTASLPVPTACLNDSSETSSKKVWTLVDCPKGVRPIGTKWVLKNKKDERGIVVRNKARLVAQGHTQEEGIDYDEVFSPVVRIEVIRLFLAYASFMGFTLPIGTKWVLKNKKDERGIVVRNKARLVAQGHTQEEGIDYDEVFAPVARIEAIRLFLAYASFMGFTVYQMDVKSAFLYGTIDEEVYVMQPPGFHDPEYPAKVYKVEKAMYGLHQAPRAWYGTLSKYLLKNGFQRGTIDQTLFIRRQREDFILVQVYVDDIIFGPSNSQLCREFEALMHKKFQMSAMGELNFFLGLQVLQKEDGIFLSQDKYIGDILKKFGFSDVRSSNTPMDKENPWGKEGPGKDVELCLYRSMIGSLMYLTASGPDIMFVVCACARYQVTPKECHLHAVKRIFRYLKGHPKLGLWYPKASSFDLVAYSDSDYGGASQDRKSTTGGSQFLGRRYLKGKPCLGLWYPKDSPFDLVAYSDSDYAGASLDKKSTTRGCQFLECRLISWQCKKQIVVATSSTEAEYVAAASGCAQPRWDYDPRKLWCCSRFIRRTRGHSKQPFILEVSPVDMMADQCTMAELLRAPTEGYAEAIVVPPILAEQFELKNNLLNMMTSDQYKDLLHAFPHCGFTELHQLDTFYNALNPVDQDSLNSDAGGNLLERRTQDVLTIIENKSKVRNSRNKSVVSQVKSCDANSNSSSEIAKLTHAVNQQISAVTTTMTAILKQFQATPPPASVKPVEEICVTCGGSGSLLSNTIANPKGKLKAITTRSGIVLDGPSVPIPPLFVNPEEDERVEETLTNQDLAEYTIKVPPPPVQRYNPPSQIDYVVHQRDPLYLNIPYPSRMLKQNNKKQMKSKSTNFGKCSSSFISTSLLLML
nr:putative ribonuclease H-like domain-containing protein [Tanacetum cinerariifolium]